MKKQNWIYQIRGLAIIAVVLCHQQGILHKTDILQMLSLYSVTTLIFLMGVTKAFSLKSHLTGNDCDKKILAYSLKSMLPTICSYIVATFFYVFYISAPGGYMDYNILLTNILSFSTCAPFYFLEYYILLSLWAPLLFSVIKNVLDKDIRKSRKIPALGMVLIIIWIIGYISIDINILGQSYLFVYSVGLLVGQLEPPKVKKIYFIPALTLFSIGLISTKRFYWARLGGVYDYSEGVDFLCPKLQMNPPNISIVLYSFGVIWVAYLVFEMIKDWKFSGFRLIGQGFSVLGKYSMDIFLWHIFIQYYLNGYFLDMENKVLKWLIYYCAMLLIPIFCRFIYNVIKKKVYGIL